MRKLFAITFVAAAFTFAACQNQTGETAETTGADTVQTETAPAEEPVETMEAPAPDTTQGETAAPDTTQGE